MGGGFMCDGDLVRVGGFGMEVWEFGGWGVG